jgi:hypothetical protein
LLGDDLDFVEWNVFYHLNQSLQRQIELLKTLDCREISWVVCGFSDVIFDASGGDRQAFNFYEGMSIDRQGRYTEVNPPKDPILGC